jgi:hypothetical protein
MGSGSGTFEPTQRFGAPEHYDDVVHILADGNGDGQLDAASVTSGPAPRIEVWPGNGDGTFGAPFAISVSSLENITDASDVNGDGSPDLVTVAQDGKVSSTIRIYLNSSHP